MLVWAGFSDVIGGGGGGSEWCDVYNWGEDNVCGLWRKDEFVSR